MKRRYIRIIGITFVVIIGAILVNIGDNNNTRILVSIIASGLTVGILYLTEV
jgi:hypothetical protein